MCFADMGSDLNHASQNSILQKELRWQRSVETSPFFPAASWECADTPANTLIWCLWLRKSLRKELKQSLQETAWEACPGPAVALWRQGLGSVFVQYGHLGHGCNCWSLQEGVCLQVIIELPFEGLFAFLSVAVVFLCGTTFEVHLSCSVFTSVSLFDSILMLASI